MGTRQASIAVVRALSVSMDLILVAFMYNKTSPGDPQLIQFSILVVLYKTLLIGPR
jgi:hypothetical protein